MKRVIGRHLADEDVCRCFDRTNYALWQLRMTPNRVRAILPAEVKALQANLRTLAEWVEAATPAPAPKGAPRDAFRHAFVWTIVGVFRRAGLAIRIGEDSDLVKVARIAFRGAGLDGDPRDLLRTLKESGELRTGKGRDAATAQGPQGAN